MLRRRDRQVANQAETLLVIDADVSRRELLQTLLLQGGYKAQVAESAADALRLALNSPPDVMLLAMDLRDARASSALTEIKELANTSQIRVIGLIAGNAAERARVLQLGADDAISVPADDEELLARVRTQLRQKRAIGELGTKVRNAEESYQVAQTAFQALAVTEKMTRDAFSLGRILRIGVGALLVLALVIAGIFFSFSHKAEKETKRAYSVIAQLEHSVQNEQQLMASARRLREDPANADLLEQKEQLQQKSQVLQQKLSAPDGGGDVTDLRKQLADTTARLSKIEGNAQAAEVVIHDFAPSVCLLHVSVAFNEKSSGKRLRYGGISSDGSPLKDSEGNTVYTAEGKAPEVRADFFGTGFIAGEGKILTNHHVVQPWWENEDMSGIVEQGLEPVIGAMEAYFPNATNGIAVGISQISQEADLALVHGDLSELRRPSLRLDSRKEAAVSGDDLISVGYATGLDAILARAGDDAVHDIVKVTGGEPDMVLAELAKRKLIRPLVTQGHVGDVLPDKIVYDAQTTSGGSGGPLLNRQGGVIGVTFAIVKGFGGSNFGVPIRFATPLLKH